MRNLILAGAAALAFAVPAAAQDTDVAVDAEGNVYVLTSEQRVMYDGWPLDRRTMYDAWPNEAKVYYWTLAPDQVEGWWMLNDEQRVRIVRMTPDQRTAAWTSIAAQMNGAAPMASTSAMATASTMATAGPMQFVRNEVVQPTGDTPVAAGAEVPICKPNQQDNCINSWEARKTGNRPLNYWPGKPASEIDTPLPAEDPND